MFILRKTVNASHVDFIDDLALRLRFSGNMVSEDQAPPVLCILCVAPPPPLSHTAAVWPLLTVDNYSVLHLQSLGTAQKWGFNT